MQNDNEIPERKFQSVSWSHRFRSTDFTISQVRNLANNEYANIMKNYKHDTNIQYGPDPQQTLDIFYKDLSSGTPLVVFIHDGAWGKMTKEFASFYVAPVVEKGYRAVIVNFASLPDVPLKDISRQLKDARKFILSYAKNSFAKNVSFIGHSSGAYLLLSLLDKTIEDESNADQILSVSLISGIYDLTHLVNTTVNKNFALFKDEKEATELSTALHSFDHLNMYCMSIFIHVGECDDQFFMEQSRHLQCHMNKSGLNVEFEMLDGMDYLQAMQCFRNQEFGPIKKVLDLIDKNNIK